MKRQPKGIPVGGQFAESARGEAAIELTPEVTEKPVADIRASREKALGLYGLTDADVPGLAEAWDEHFASLDRPTARTPEVIAWEAVSDSIRDFPDSSVSIEPAKYFAHGHDDVGTFDLVAVAEIDGHCQLNECYCEDEENGDDDRCVATAWDRSSGSLGVESGYDGARIAFRLTPEQIQEASAAADDSSLRELQIEQRNRLSEMLRIEGGNQAPWSVIADPDEVKQLQQDRLAASHRVPHDYEIKNLEQELQRISPVFEAYDKGEKIPAFPGFISVPSQYGNNDTTTAHSGLSRDVQERREAVERHRVASAAMREAQALPDGELKDWLLADRPERSYQATEGTGRNKRTVTRRYTPPAPLVEEAGSAAKAEARTQHVDRVMDALRDRAKDHRDRMASVDALKAERDAAGYAVWSAGWTGKGPAPRSKPGGTVGV